MDRNRILWLVVCLLIAGSLKAQDRYMVFFNDKANSAYSAGLPLEFLSQRAIDRRVKQSISVTEEDFPVNASYVQEVRDAGAAVYLTSRWKNAALVEMSSSLESSILGLACVASVEFVAPGSKLSTTKVNFSIAETFTDPEVILANTDVQIRMLGADRLHSDGFDGSGMLIAVFDGGFIGVNNNSPFQHLHDEGRIIAELDFVENSGNPYQYASHGTNVLSCIAGAYENDTLTFIGTAPKAKFILAVTEEVATEYRVEEYNWLLAAEYADSAGVDVINSSLGYTDFDDSSMDYTYENMDGQTTVTTQAANLAASKGILVVNSAGNAGSDSDSSDGSTIESCKSEGNWCYIGAPADSPNVLAVGAVGGDKSRASFSSFGPSYDGRTKPDVSAMGLQTTVVYSSGNIGTNNGTSFSSPLMAGYAASLWQAYPELTNMELMDLIKNTASQTSSPDNELGYGIPHYLIVLGTSVELGKRFKVYPNPTESSLTIERIDMVEIAYTLSNLEGKTMIRGVLRIGEDQVKINSSFKSGIYFLRLQSGEQVETIKLLKK
ncbi:MAG: S8 family serine peptidase [Cytophagales bacterium]|nr:S8 family serine peptidase [Cytophagales bacterium]